MKIKKEDYQRFLVSGSLAIETYCDLNNIDTHENEQISNFFAKMKEYYDLSRKRIEIRDEAVEDLIDLINNIGEDKFSINDNGEIGYDDK